MPVRDYRKGKPFLDVPGEAAWPPPVLWRDSWAWALLAIGLTVQGIVQWEVHRETAVGDDSGRTLDGSLVRGGTLDDTYIHMMYARNLMRGKGFVYNAGEPSPGSTSPGWVVLLAAVSMREEWLRNSAVLLSVLFYVATGIAAHRLARRLGLGARTAFFGGLMALLSGRMVWAGVSGMETCAFSFFSLVALGAHVEDRRREHPGPWAALLFGLASGFRPEGYLLFLIAFLDHAISYDPETRAFHLTIRPFLRRRAAAALAVYALCIGPYMLFCLSTNGHPFPNTYYSKRHPSMTTSPVVHLQMARHTLLAWQAGQGALSLLAPAGALALMALSYLGRPGQWPRLRRARLLWLWPRGFAAYSAALNPFLVSQFGRYLIPFIPFYLLLGLIALGAAREWIRRLAGTRQARRLVWAAGAAIVAPALWAVPAWGDIAGRCVDNINQQQVKIGKWMKEYLPPGVTVALHDAGAIPYFSECFTIDALGLVTTDAMKILLEESAQELNIRGSPGVMRYIRDKRPDYIVGYPQWLPIAALHEEAFDVVFDADVGERIIISGEKRMIVWRAHWDRYDPKVDEQWVNEYMDILADYGAGAPQTAPVDGATTQTTGPVTAGNQ